MRGTHATPGPVLALTGGIGGAKLARGLHDVLPAGRLTLGVNTGDDFEHLGLTVWPDFDTTLYTLAGVHDVTRGWGRAEESWQFMDTIRRFAGRLGAEEWFNLGDRDLGVHVLRSAALRAGRSFGEVAGELCAAFDVTTRILPASEDPIRTQIETPDGWLDFQTYFVRERARPAVRRIRYAGAETARPSPDLLALLARPDLAGIVLCPSNPFLSIAPMLALPRLREALCHARAPVIAVTPLIGGRAVKGPTAKIMGELGLSTDPISVARLYTDFLDGFILDTEDQVFSRDIEALGLRCETAPTLMTDNARKQALACLCLDFLGDLRTNADLRAGAAR